MAWNKQRETGLSPHRHEPHGRGVVGRPQRRRPNAKPRRLLIFICQTAHWRILEEQETRIHSGAWQQVRVAAAAAARFTQVDAAGCALREVYAPFTVTQTHKHPAERSTPTNPHTRTHTHT